MNETRDLAKILTDPREEKFELRWGTIAAVGVNTVDVYLGGAATTIPGVRFLHSYTNPEVGDQVAIFRSGPDLFVAGTIGEAEVAPPPPDVGGVHGLDDDFEDAALDGDWVTVLPSGTCTWTEGDSPLDGGVLGALFNNQTSEHAACILKPIAGSDWGIGDYIETAMRAIAVETYAMAGLIITDGTAVGSKSVWQMPYWYWDGTYNRLTVSLRSGLINGAKTSHYSIQAHMTGGWLYQRLTYVAANTWKAQWSLDGVVWHDYLQANPSYTMTPTHVGLAVSTWAGDNGHTASFAYFKTGPA